MLADVADKVDEYTAKIAGDQKMVQDTPIELKVYRHDQDDLTLVDLPGITRTAREGQQGTGKALEEMILNMCRRYCAPEESVILNVVSAMVDFSTSASLQLSQELDPTSRRTLLCVTKIDQHQEEGLAKKLSSAASQLKLRSDRVFAVRNRKQQENEQRVTLAEARRTEANFFATHEEMRRGAQQCGYGLGISELSERLVSIQLERIQETLPATYAAIVERMTQLRQRSDQIGKPLGDELSCRVLAHNLVDRCMEGLAMERNGRVGQHTRRGGDAESPLGAHDELSVVVPKIEDWRKRHAPGDVKTSEEVEMPGSLRLQLQFRPLGDASKKSEAEPAGIGAFIHCVAMPDGATAIECDVEVELSRADGTTIRKISTSSCALTDGMTRGWSTFLAGTEASKLTGEVELHACIYIKSVTWAGDEEVESHDLLCAIINDLDDEFASDVNAAHSDRSFFSSAFLAKLKSEADARRGAAGLPGAIAPDVPVGILSNLTKKLAPIVEGHVNAFHDAVAAKIEHVVSSHIDVQVHPRFHGLLLQSATKLLDDCTAAAQRECARLLAYEDACCWTANHYYMDIVQDLRREILADTEGEPVFAKRPYLRNFALRSSRRKATRSRSSSI